MGILFAHNFANKKVESYDDPDLKALCGLSLCLLGKKCL